MTTIQYQTLYEIYSDLERALLKRRFEITRLSPHQFVGFNPNYGNNPVKIHVNHEQKFISIIICDENGMLLPEDQKMILESNFGEYFEPSPNGGIQRIIPKDIPVYQDMGEIANIVTQAYSLLVA